METIGEQKFAFAQIFETHHKPVLKLCLHLTGNLADAEDAFQAAFLAIYEALPTFNRQSKFSTWMYRIVLRTALRAKGKRRDLQPLGTHDPAEEVADPVVKRQTGEVLARALQRLSAEHRTVLSLFAVQELSHREIASLLGIPEGTVWSRLHTARKKLTMELSQGGYHREDL